MLKMAKIDLELIQNPDIRGVQEVELPIFLINTAKPTMYIQNLMTQKKNQNIT